MWDRVAVRMRSGLGLVGSFLREWVPLAVTTVVAPSLFVITALVPHPHLTWSVRQGTSADWLFRSGVAALLIGSWIIVARELRRGRRLRDLECVALRATESERALASLARDEVRRLANSLQLFSNGRVSLFRAHDDDHFDLVARYSADPSKDHGPGRGRFPIDEAVLGQAWRTQRVFPPPLPAPGPVNAAPFLQWLDAQERLGLPRHEAEALTLRARTYGAVRIDSGGHSLGVIVFEDTRGRNDESALGAGSNAFKESVVEAHLDAATGARLAALLIACQAVPCEDWSRVRVALAAPRRSP
ncbi:MAG: hypothetical protein JWM02_3126 [Frankiales bacterium]|nr:hypothetical protein [Frankiales bacterium]